MRRDFHPLLLDRMRKDDRICVITADLGFKFFDHIATEFPDRFWNVGAAECLAVGAAVGLAEDGKIPIVYSITPFLLYRPAEWIRNYLHNEQVPVKLLAGGRDKDYSHDGFTHEATDDRQFLSLFKIRGFWPQDIQELREHSLDAWLNEPGPAYLNLRR